MNVENLGEALQRPFVPIRFLIGSGILPEDCKLVLYGVFKAGKSTLLTYIGLCCAGGIPLFGSNHFSTEKSKVLFIQLEMPHKAFLKRLKDSSLSQIQDVRDNFFLTTEFWLKLDTNDGLNKLETAIKDIVPDILIIDPFYKLLSGSENSSQDVDRVTGNLDILISQYHFALIVSAQARKTLIVPKLGTVDLGDQEIRGSTGIPGWVDSIIGLRRGADTKRTLNFSLRHGDKEAFVETISWDRSSGLFQIA